MSRLHYRMKSMYTENRFATELQQGEESRGFSLSLHTEECRNMWSFYLSTLAFSFAIESLFPSLMSSSVSLVHGRFFCAGRTCGEASD